MSRQEDNYEKGIDDEYEEDDEDEFDREEEAVRED